MTLTFLVTIPATGSRMSLRESGMTGNLQRVSAQLHRPSVIPDSRSHHSSVIPDSRSHRPSVIPDSRSDIRNPASA